MDPLRIGPQEGPQTAFLSSTADIAIYGGAAGSGKSFAATLEPLRHLNNSTFGSVTFRRTTPEITKQGGLWDESSKLYPSFGAVPNLRDLFWTFPTGMRCAYSHLQYLKTIYSWQGSQVPLFIYDELTHFLKQQFFYLATRSRSMSNVVPYIRATTNPDADSWVAELIEWWIDQDTGYPLLERSGVIRWMISVNDVVYWADSFEEACSYAPDPIVAARALQPKSVTFIPATIEDNPILLEANPGYLGSLLMQDLVTRERLLKGNWKIRPVAGNIFNQAWFRVIPDGTAPRGGAMCRFWDLAATKPKLAKDDPDFTAGVLMQRTPNGDIIIHDSISVREGPASVNKMIKNQSWNDYYLARRMGCTYMVRWEEEGGASGPRDSASLVKLLIGLDAKGEKPSGDKITRAKPLAAYALNGNVAVVDGPWVKRYLQHMHNQPQWSHDDEMDGSSGCFNALSKARPASGAASDTGYSLQAAQGDSKREKSPLYDLQN